MPRLLTVVFGAGASFDSIPAVSSISDFRLPRGERRRRDQYQADYRPPLGSQLFEARPFFDKVLAEHRSIAILAKQLRALPSTVGLESELDRLQEKARGDPTLRRELASMRYYLKRVLWESSDRWAEWSPGDTNYHRLLRTIKQWRDRAREAVALVTFNYDLLLEHAVRDSIGGVDLTTIAGLTARPHVKVMRPHGAVNWARAIDSDIAVCGGRSQRDVERDVIDAAGSDTGLPLRGFAIVPALKTFQIGGQALFPALTLPVRTKGLELPAIHQEELEQALAESSRVILIGWRASETNFLELWGSVRRAPLQLLVVSSGAGRAEATLERVTKYLDTTDALTSPSAGFSEFVKAREFEDFVEL